MDESQQREFVTPEIEKRRHRRAKLVTEVKCDALSRDEFLVTRDISAGGLFVITKTPLPLGSLVGLSFSLGTGAPPMTCHGKVVYSQQGLGMGIQFDELSYENLRALEKFIDESL
jgi:hypothetical protein